MKREAYVLLTSLFIFLLISHKTSSARIPQNNDQGSASSMANMEEEDDVATLMGFEECKESEEDCIKRRMIADAHLDYIYTQHHKPGGSP